MAQTTGGGGNATKSMEVCPVCKTSSYFNRDMEFLINPECYHRMCKTCVERIFKDGPNQCPYANCQKTLRLRGFESAFFADLSVEREVDIRRRVAAVFNKVEDDFDDLNSYNDYLDMVECLTADLVSGSEEARFKAESKLMEWEAQHKAEIERNRRLARESEETRQKRMAAEREAAQQLRQQDLQAEREERASAARFREEMLDSLQSAEAGRAREVVNKVLLKKRGQQRRDAAIDSLAANSGLSIRGLRDKKAAVQQDDGPYDPYAGLSLRPERVDLSADKLQKYNADWLTNLRTKDDFVVGGYDANEYVSQLLYEAFSGLAVFVDEDKGEKGVTTQGALESADMGLTTGAMDIDDAF